MRRFVLSSFIASFVVVGCAVPMEDDEEEGSIASEIAVNDIMGRAQQWVDLKVPYCGGVRGGRDLICGGTCRRPSAPWNNYRTDCSGFVSWAWQIPDVPATATYVRDRGGPNGWRTVAIDDLQTGDAMVANGHIKLFSKMVGSNAAEILEEYGCGKVARKAVQSFTRLGGTTFRFNGDSRVYHPIRRNDVTGGGPGVDAPDTVETEGTQVFATGKQQHFFVRNANGDLEHAFWDANTNQIAHDMWGAAIAGDPATFVAGEQQHAFARGADGTLQHWFWDGGMNHDVWGDGLASDPTAIKIGDGQHAFATDAAGNLQHWWWAPGRTVARDTWGGGVVGRPSAMVDGDQQHAFARGKDGSLQHFFFSPGAKGIAHDTWAGAGAIAGDPVARVIGDQQHVFAVDGAGALQHWFWDRNTGKIAHDTWASSGLAADGRPTTMLTGEQQHVFARGANGSVEHYFWFPGATAISHDTWGGGISGEPSAMVVGDQQHVFAQSADGKMQHWFWDAGTGKIAHDTW